YLKDGAPKAEIAPVTAFETGTDAWRRLPAWPPKAGPAGAGGPGRLYLRSGLKLRFDAPAAGESAFDGYLSHPAPPGPPPPPPTPVCPCRRRPVQPMGYAEGQTWSRWLADDQREASGRPDVLAYVSDELTGPLKIAGEPVAHLVASTGGSDSDWVVKLIDVYPDEVAGQAELGGYQLMIAADVFRGRYRESLETAKAIPAGEALTYRFALPTANHVFLPGHRMMVQVQSSWFPLYDRNPQTFVPNIFWARPGDYAKAIQRVFHEPGRMSFVDLPV